MRTTSTRVLKSCDTSTGPTSTRRQLWLPGGVSCWKCVAAVVPRLPRFSRERFCVADTLAEDFERPVPAYDIIIGNPPYRRELGTKSLLDRIAITSLGRRWRTARMDLWYYFVHRGLELLADDGILSFIVSGYWTAGSGAGKTRRTASP